MSCLRLLLPLAAAVAFAVPAEAGTRSLAIDAATTNEGLELLLLSSGTTFGLMRFALPVDFKKNSEAKLRVTLQAFTVESYPCTIQFGLKFAVRGRAGKNQVGGSAANFGFPGSGETGITFSGTVAVVKTYKMVGMTSGPLQGQRKGDTFIVSFEREGDDSEDTCANIEIAAVQLIYKTP